MTYTPGPWKQKKTVIGDDYDIAIVANDGDKVSLIAEVYKVVNQSGRKADVKANARLIAAAPEMLEVCQFALKKLNRMTTDEFSKGGDKEIREKLDRVLALVGE